MCGLLMFLPYRERFSEASYRGSVVRSVECHGTFSFEGLKAEGSGAFVVLQ